MKWTLSSFITIAGVTGSLTVVVGAQTVGPAALPAVTVVSPARYVVIDDQLFDVTGMPDVGGPARSRPQGVTLDSDAVTGNLKFQGWEGGVIPIEFASDVTQSQRDQYMRVCNSGWGSAANVLCIPRTSQNGYLRVTEAVQETANGAPCFSVVGQPRRLTQYENHLGPNCWTDATIYHEQGHALGFIHEHQRPNRDDYLFIDTSNVAADVMGNFTKITSLSDREGSYDFLSIMHYRNNAFALDSSKPTMFPRTGYGSYTNTMGTSAAPTSLDRDALFNLYSNYFRTYTYTPLVTTTQFDRTDFLDAMERLHAFYSSRMGLIRPAGLSIGGKPDFLGIATWIFDVYLGARSRGFSPDLSFSIVVTDISQSAEWKGKHPGGTSGSRSAFTPTISFDRNEFLDALQKLDAFYAAPEGLKRPNGLSISGGPDFLGIATWIFDVYLNERLRGGSPTLAWTRVVNAIQSTPEWKSKH